LLKSFRDILKYFYALSRVAGTFPSKSMASFPFLCYYIQHGFRRPLIGTPHQAYLSTPGRDLQVSDEAERISEVQG
jgi:hypothetical protein